MIDTHTVDIVQPDVMYMGGLTRTLQVAKMAEAKGLPVTPHAANLSLVTLCTMHLLKALPNAGKYLEFSIEGPDYYPWQNDLFATNPFAITAGHVTVPNTPGWGAEPNPAHLARCTHQTSSLGDTPSAYAALYHKPK